MNQFIGVTLALSDTLADICLVACQKAKEKGVLVFCLKRSIERDYYLVSIKEIKSLMSGNKNGMVQK